MINDEVNVANILYYDDRNGWTHIDVPPHLDFSAGNFGIAVVKSSPRMEENVTSEPY
jgi:hypothetical protein